MVDHLEPLVRDFVLLENGQDQSGVGFESLIELQGQTGQQLHGRLSEAGRGGSQQPHESVEDSRRKVRQVQMVRHDFYCFESDSSGVLTHGAVVEDGDDGRKEEVKVLLEAFAEHLHGLEQSDGNGSLGSAVLPEHLKHERNEMDEVSPEFTVHGRHDLLQEKNDGRREGGSIRGPIFLERTIHSVARGLINEND